MRKNFLVLLLMLTATAANTFAAEWYVRKGATGSNNGTDWNNAWNEMSQINWANVSCGDKVWLAGGTYTTSLSLSKACTSGNVLTINRVLATDAVPTAAAGWNSSFDSQVILNNVPIVLKSGAYYTVNGRVGQTTGTGASGDTPATAYGISVRLTGSGSGVPLNTGNLDHITFAYIELYGPPCVDTSSCSSGVQTDGLNLASSTSSVTFLDVTHCYFHRWAELVRTSNWSDDTIEYTTLGHTHNDGPEHEDVMFNYELGGTFTFRYNDIWMSPNDGIFFFGNVNDLEMYGNTYHHSGGSILDFYSGFTFHVQIYNNVFSSDQTFGDYVCPGNCPWLYFQGTIASDSNIVNNIFDHIAFSGSPGGTKDYNAYSSDVGKQDSGTHSFTYTSSFSATSVFVNTNTSNAINADFHLTSSGVSTFAGKGKNVGAPYTTDMDGNTCASTATTCNLGPFQSSSASTSNPPAPPSNLAASVQ